MLHAQQLPSLQCEQILKKAIEHQKKGFAVVELVSFCHTQFGRKNKRSRPMDNINYLKDNSVMKAKADTMTAEELKGKIIIGEFVNIEDAREYTERYDESHRTRSEGIGGNGS